jgi:hypothetical protein
MPPKECFGQLANLKIILNNSTQRHYLRRDDEKLKECDTCNLFTKCMFLKYNDIVQEALEIADAAAEQGKPRRLG